MGRLDEMAKRKVVELREAGLSFRKIKAVLELENIKVSAQAIYLFLKEFQGRARREAEAAAGVVGGAHVLPVPSWEQSEQHLRNLLPRTSCSSSDAAGGAAGAERDEDVRIVSVTSLAHDAQGPRPALSAGSAFARRRHAPSPANPVLVARRRLLDKALLHRARVSGSQSGQQVALSGKSPCFSEGRKVVFPHTDTYDLTTARPTSMRGLHPGAGPHRRSLQQRSIAPPTPRVGIHLPNPAPAAPPQADPGAPSGLQEQIQSLGAELRNLGVALRVLAEQQGRLEREQAQQTQVQRLILVTLQEVSAKLPRCPAYALRPLQDPALDAIEAFSLEQLGQPAINGFPGGSSFTHSQAPPFAPDAPEPAFPPCSPPSSVGVSAGQPELNIIKVESV